jgi:DNA-binding CsgD family transcriptional regulator
MNRGHKVLTETLDELRAHPLISLGFSLFWVWVWVVVQSSFLNSGLFAGPIAGRSNWIVPLSAYGGTFLLLGILYKQTGIMFSQKPYLIALALTTSFGMVTCALFALFPTVNETINAVLFVLGGIIMGAGTACIHMEWGRLLGRLGPHKTIIHGTVGTFGAMLLMFLIAQLPEIYVLVLVALFPLGCMFTIIRQSGTLPTPKPDTGQANLHIPWRFLCTSFIQGVSFGILQTILLLQGTADITTIVSGSASFVGAITFFAVALFFRLDFNQLIYQVGFILLAFSFTLMAVAGQMFIGGWFLNAVGYRFIDILMWALCTHLIKQRGLPTNWVFAITTCALLIGQVTGALIGMVSQSLFTLPINGLDVLSVLMAFFILTGAVLMVDKNNLQAGWGMFRPALDNEFGNTFDTRCALVCDGFELTRREFEIFKLLAQGHGRLEIGTDLHLSKETVKTHIRNIYRKMDIHSQQEAIKLVDA